MSLLDDNAAGADKGAAGGEDKGAADAAAKAAADKAAADAAAGAQTPEQKAAAEKAAADKAAADKAAVVPEKYEFKAPVGVELDSELTGELSALAKEAKLPQAQAQKFADLGAKLMQKQSTALQAAIEKVQSGWIEATKADKEIGGAGLEQNLAIAKKALDAFGGPELVKALNETGLGNHPEFIRAFVKIGKAISEDKLVTGKTGTITPDSASVFSYPNSKHS